jgi:hypothetical protein
MHRVLQTFVVNVPSLGGARIAEDATARPTVVMPPHQTELAPAAHALRTVHPPLGVRVCAELGVDLLRVVQHASRAIAHATTHRRPEHRTQHHAWRTTGQPGQRTHACAHRQRGERGEHGARACLLLVSLRQLQHTFVGVALGGLGVLGCLADQLTSRV